MILRDLNSIFYSIFSPVRIDFDCFFDTLIFAIVFFIG